MYGNFETSYSLFYKKREVCNMAKSDSDGGLIKVQHVYHKRDGIIEFAAPN
jgi:hypothetical protein